MSEFKLGRSAKSPIDPRTFKLEKFLKVSALPPNPPAYVAPSLPLTVTWGMMGNNSLGDCVFAGVGHMIMAWTNANKALIKPSDAAVIENYKRIAGYIPGHPETDNGWYLSDMMNHWRNEGFIVSVGNLIITNADGTKTTQVIPTAYNRIHSHYIFDWKNHETCKTVAYNFGGGYMGIALPNYFKNQKTTWGDPPAGTKAADIVPGSWGLHCIYYWDYNAIGPRIITWGGLRQMTWAAWDKYIDESRTAASLDQIDNTTLKTITGFDLAAAEAALAAL